LRGNDNEMKTEHKAQATDGEIVLSAIGAAAQEFAGFFMSIGVAAERFGKVVDAVGEVNQAVKRLDQEEEEEDFIDAEYRESKS